MKWWNCKIIIIIDSESCSAGPSHKKQEGTKGRKEEGRKEATGGGVRDLSMDAHLTPSYYCFKHIF